ncbi:hypothetical protein F8E02_02935 [Methanoculleus sp. Wushi-C6]|uniref:Uncharacterized protein n=1 Tax=Methanoculleus caldifontis TaxID=2651577 RepID=A0ABU3WYW8_9EURY|nr:hypothetical protein [Methanoculleus sp. Wushi-C6]MDV2480978.1 hypothetical protein [Methanoculleus sp. Wushi-C6]
MHSKVWVWLGFGAVLVLAVASLAILAAFPADQHTQEPVKRVDWILPFGPGFDYRGPGESLVIVYDADSETWHLKDATTWNRTISLGDRYSLDPAHPEDIRYTPDTLVEGDKISLNFFVRNLAGEDCAHADLAVTTEVASLNAATGSPEGDILPGAVIALSIDDLAAGEWREVRVTADLPRHAPEEVLSLTIGLAAPYTFTAPNGTPITFDFWRMNVVSGPGPASTSGDVVDPGYTPDPDYNRARLPMGSATFVVAGIDAPEPVPRPTLQAG